MSKEIDLAVSRSLPEIAAALDATFQTMSGNKLGFTLIVYNTEGGGSVNYISNCTREDNTKALQVLLDKWNNPETADVPAHELN